MGSRTYSFDAKMLVSDNGAAYTANGPGLVGGVQKIVDFGGLPRRTDLGIVGGWARIDLACVIDVYAMNLANANNHYIIQAIGSNVSNTLAGGQVLGECDLGNTGALTSGAMTSLVGRYEVLFTTEQADINYEYVGLYVICLGTSPSINFQAFLAVLPKE